MVRRPIWEGRYFLAETTGDKLVMPWSNGREIAYQDMTMEAYDNAKKKFVSAMVDNHFDTGILLFEGDYDPATKTISYTCETEDSPGVKQKNWKLIRFMDKNHYVEEGYVEEVRAFETSSLLFNCLTIASVQQKLRPYLAKESWHDKTLELWIEIFEALT